jgi:hypothetical protein
MTNLSEQDLKRIKAIEVYLQEFARKYNHDAPVDNFTPYQPIDTTEGEPIETEQRLSVNVRPMRHNFNDHEITIYLNDGVLSITEAQKAAEAIKQYLSTNF